MTTKHSLHDIIKAAIEDYTEQFVLNLQYVPDPAVPGSYAVRAEFGYHQVYDFVVQTKRTFGVVSVPVEDIEEVKFSCWPPRPNSKKGGEDGA